MAEETNKDWWQAALNRRDTTKLGVGVAAVAAIAGCGDGSKVEEMNTLEAQKKGGWDVGDTGVPLLFAAGVKPTDSKGGLEWDLEYKRPEKLLEVVKPNDAELAKLQMPSLAQSLNETTLAMKMKAVSSRSTEESYKQARAVGALLSSVENPEKTVLVVDLPTAHAPAAAAGMAEHVEPVFMMDNWPHPKGAVKSQDTLGSLLYYARELEEKKAARAGKKVPAAFILDSTRLNDGKEPGSSDFDNRYFVDLPDADTLKKMGVENVMYVTLGEAAAETDDINDSFADYKDGGLKVSNIALTNFGPDPSHTPAADDPSHGYYYHRSHHHHTGFYHHYPMFIWIPMGRYGWGSTMTRSMPSTMRAPSYAPTRRPTAFSSRTTGGARGVGRAKPAGFGRVSTRVSKSGRIVGTKTGSVGRYRSSRTSSGG